MSEAYKTIYIYLETLKESANQHEIVMDSFSDSQLEKNSNEDVFSKCGPLVHFGDFESLLGMKVNTPLDQWSASAEDRETIRDDAIVFPCGLRALSSLMRRRSASSNH